MELVSSLNNVYHSLSCTFYCNPVSFFVLFCLHCMPCRLLLLCFISVFFLFCTFLYSVYLCVLPTVWVSLGYVVDFISLTHTWAVKEARRAQPYRRPASWQRNVSIEARKGDMKQSVVSCADCWVVSSHVMSFLDLPQCSGPTAGCTVAAFPAVEKTKRKANKN